MIFENVSDSPSMHCDPKCIEYHKKRAIPCLTGLLIVAPLFLCGDAADARVSAGAVNGGEKI